MKLFLSHAASNKDIADSLCTLLGDGLNITRNTIFCSSLPGQKVPGGFDFVKHIKDKLTNADVVICLLSENYIDSQFCMAELGASWVLSKRIIPLIVPPLSYDSVKATLTLTQAWRINDVDSLDSFANDIKETDVNVARWGVACRTFIGRINRLIEQQPKPEKVLFFEHEKVQKELEYAEEFIRKKDNEISQLNSEIAERKKCKDKTEVERIEKEFMSEFEAFDAAITPIKKILSSIPGIVGKAIYYETNGENLPYPASFDDDCIIDLRNAKNSGYLSFEEDEPIRVNYANPNLSKIREHIDSLRTFLESASVEFIEMKQNEDAFECSLEIIDFWDKYLF